MSIQLLSIIGASGLFVFAVAEHWYGRMRDLRDRAEEAEAARTECEKQLDRTCEALADERRK